MTNAQTDGARLAPVGITKGPGETIHEYTFISRDEQRAAQEWRVCLLRLRRRLRRARANGQRRHARVLGRILQRVPVQLYPDTFLSEPAVSPCAGRRDVGYDQRANDLFELHVAIMGYFDAALGSFVNPWIPPSSGTPIFLADDAWLGDGALAQAGRTAVGSAHIGSLLTRPDGAVPVVLDVKETGQHASGDHRQHRRGQELSGQRHHRGADAPL